MQQKFENRREKKLYMKCRQNMKEICQLRNRIHRLENNVILEYLEENHAVEVLTNIITPSLALMLQGEINFFNRKLKGRKWTRNQKITALRLYIRSPTCYNLIRRIFCLPAPSTLKTLLNQCPFHAGINQKVFEMLKKFTATQYKKDNQYVLMFDEMSLRKHLQYNNKDDKIEGFQDHATQGRAPQTSMHALVFMICGIRKKLKQPISFFLSDSSVTADRLAALIMEVLSHCFEARINVLATVCDMKKVNRRALGILGATSQNPNITINDCTITTMFDPPHLLKRFRNILMKYDINYDKHLTNFPSGAQTGKGIAKWEHIKQFYELDSINPIFVFAPSLRQEHLTPNTKQKKRLVLAAQILSHSVAVGMFCKSSEGHLPAEAEITASMIASMDKLFDCLNSNSQNRRRGKPHSTNLKGNTPHLKYFKVMKQFFQSLELIGCHSKPPSIEGWVWTLNGIEIIWKRLSTKHPNTSLATRRLQLDPLENLFGCIRRYCGSNTKPTTEQFISGIKTAVLSSLVNTGSRKGKCEIDDNLAILENFKIS